MLILCFLSEKSAYLHLDPTCPSSRTSWINTNVTEIPEVLDSNASTCLNLSGIERNWAQISLPVIQIRPQIHVRLIGNLACSPLSGLSVSVVGDCETGMFRNSMCIPSDYFTSDGMVGCKYRCQSVGICNDVIVDIVGLSNIAQPKSICEIVY